MCIGLANVHWPRQFGAGFEQVTQGVTERKSPFDIFASFREDSLTVRALLAVEAQHGSLASPPHRSRGSGIVVTSFWWAQKAEVDGDKFVHCPSGLVESVS